MEYNGNIKLDRLGWWSVAVDRCGVRRWSWIIEGWDVMLSEGSGWRWWSLKIGRCEKEVVEDGGAW